MKYKVIIAAALLLVGIAGVASAHEFENKSQCDSTCGGSCVYSDCLACPAYSGACFAMVRGCGCN